MRGRTPAAASGRSLIARRWTSIGRSRVAMSRASKRLEVTDDRSPQRQAGRTVSRAGRSPPNVAPVAASNPLSSVPALGRDLERVETPAAPVGAGRGPVPDRGGQPPDQGRRQARAPGLRRHRRRHRPAHHGRVARRGHQRRRVGRARPPRLAVPRRRHRRRVHPSHGRHRQRPVGQPQGDPGRRLPAGPGVRDRRVARHRGGRPAGRHHRPAVRGPDPRAAAHLRPDPHRGELPRLDRRQDGRAPGHGVSHRRHRGRPAPAPHRRADPLRPQLRHGLPDRRRHPRRHRHRRGAGQAVGQRPGAGRLHAPRDPGAGRGRQRCRATRRDPRPTALRRPSGTRPGRSSGRAGRSTAPSTWPAATPTRPPAPCRTWPRPRPEPRWRRPSDHLVETVRVAGRR